MEIPKSFKLTHTPAGKRAQTEVEVVREYEGKRQCSFCRGQLQGAAAILLGGRNSRRQIHRWCWQWILEQSHEHVPDADGLALKMMKKQELDAQIDEFIEENKERIRQRELERRGLA